MSTKIPRRSTKSRVRLTSAGRRQALIQAAAELMTQRGVDAVQFADVARAAGVTRQLVYKFFPNRQTLILAVLADFEAELTQRFAAGSQRAAVANLADATRVFVEAVCNTIEAKGAGPWRLLDAKGPDAEVARFGRAIEDRLVTPWHDAIAATTGADAREVATLARMIVAAGRAVLEQWYGGALTRDEAVRDATRGVTALLQVFTVPPRPPARAPRRRRTST